MNNKQDKILLIGIVLALIIGMSGLGMGIKSVKRDVLEKDIQINSMVEEIGHLKEENQYIYRNLVTGITAIEDTFTTLNGSIENISEIENLRVSALSADFAEAKENAIAQLERKNERLVQEASIQNYTNGIFTVLILGTNENLTDTIMLAAINPFKETVALISVPRDLYYNGRKINSIYASYGIEKIKQDISKISGLEINKHIVLNLEAFEEVIDILGGIDIYVQKDIYDPYFPTASSGYKEYKITEGTHNMDGKEALMYARSRKTTSDFDRSKRQQSIIQAIRVKVKMLDLISDIDKAIQIYGSVSKNIKTDIGVFEALNYLDNYKNYAIKSGNVISTDNFLYSSKTVSGQYILLPKAGDYVDIKKSISTLIIE